MRSKRENSRFLNELCVRNVRIPIFQRTMRSKRENSDFSTNYAFETWEFRLATLYDDVISDS